MSDETQDAPDNLPATTGAEAPESAGRLAEIEDMMADTRGPYWNGSKSDALQAEYRELLDRQGGDTAAQAGADQAMTAADVAGSLDVIGAMGEVGAEWASDLRDSGNLGALEVSENVRSDIMADMGTTADEVASAFDGLGDNVRAAVYRELGSAYVPQQPAADPADLAEFSGTSAGQILVEEWGDEAGRKLAVALYRWDRMIADLTETEEAEIDDFYRLRLRPQERAAVLRRLAA